MNNNTNNNTNNYTKNKTNNNTNGCFRQNVTPTTTTTQKHPSTPSSSSATQKHLHTAEEYDHDYSVRIWKPSNSPSPMVFINADFNNSDGLTEPYDGVSFTINEQCLSIELGTHDERTIAEVTSLCKTIAENMAMLDDLLMRL